MEQDHFIGSKLQHAPERQPMNEYLENLKQGGDDTASFHDLMTLQPSASDFPMEYSTFLLLTSTLKDNNNEPFDLSTSFDIHYNNCSSTELSQYDKHSPVSFISSNSNPSSPLTPMSFNSQPSPQPLKSNPNSQTGLHCPSLLGSVEGCKDMLKYFPIENSEQITGSNVLFNINNVTSDSIVNNESNVANHKRDHIGDENNTCKKGKFEMDLPANQHTDALSLRLLKIHKDPEQKMCVESDGDENSTMTGGDKDGDTPLHIIIAKFEDPKERDQCKKEMEILENTKQLKQYINFPNKKLEYPIHLAVVVGDIELLKAILDSGANANLRDNDLNTPIHALLKTYDQFGYEKTRDILNVIFKHTKYSIDLDAVDEEGLAPIHLAADTGNLELMKLLKKHGADINKQEEKCGQSALVRTIIEADKQKDPRLREISFTFARNITNQLKVDVTVETYSKNTALHMACQVNHKELVIALIDKGAEVNLKNSDRRTEKDLTNDCEIKEILEKKFRKKRRSRRNGENQNMEVDDD